MQTLDWIWFGALAVLMIGAGLWATNKSGKDLSSYFLGGRNLPWWMAGISMVATTFAADTPLAVTELVAANGISGNWLWWNLLAGGMLTTFFFANLWRRSGVLTEVEFIQLRYGGKPAAFLRPFKAVYLGLIMNVLIIGWVNLAMVTILSGFFDISESTAFLYTAIAMGAVAIYSSFSGLLGVVITDNIQFVIAMTGSIALAYFVLDNPEVGGMSGLIEKLPESAFAFFPEIQAANSDVLSISAAAFFAFFGMMWWASWYPGAEPGGGGYIAQRMMSTKDEKHAVYATLFFQIAHYCIRPWPWIIVGLAAITMYSVPQHLSGEMSAEWSALAEQGPVEDWISGKTEVPAQWSQRVNALSQQMDAQNNPKLDESLRYQADPRFGYIFALKNNVPSGWMGVLLVGFFAAYMSTISTQLNWGASYLINDLYALKPERRASSNLVLASRITVLLLAVVGMVVSLYIESISGVWQFIMECGAGLGLVLILRWFWWRINAWSEITATVAPFIGYALAKFVFDLAFPHSFFVTVGFTTISWLLVTFFTQPEKKEILQAFYNRIQPDGMWDPFRNSEEDSVPGRLWRLTVCWLSAVVMTYSLLFAMGKLLFMEYSSAGIYAAVSLAAFALLRYQLVRTRILK